MPPKPSDWATVLQQTRLRNRLFQAEDAEFAAAAGVKFAGRQRQTIKIDRADKPRRMVDPVGEREAVDLRQMASIIAKAIVLSGGRRLMDLGQGRGNIADDRRHPCPSERDCLRRMRQVVVIVGDDQNRQAAQSFPVARSAASESPGASGWQANSTVK